jgi:hypothetical protein
LHIVRLANFIKRQCGNGQHGGQPLRYRQQGAGYALYSIGPDLKDDGGKRMKGKDGDMAFSVTTPPVP